MRFALVRPRHPEACFRSTGVEVAVPAQVTLGKPWRRSGKGAGGRTVHSLPSWLGTPRSWNRGVEEELASVIFQELNGWANSRPRWRD